MPCITNPLDSLRAVSRVKPGPTDNLDMKIQCNIWGAGAQFALSKFRDSAVVCGICGGDFVRSMGFRGRNIIIRYSLSTVAKIVTATEGNTSVRGGCEGKQRCC